MKLTINGTDNTNYTVDTTNGEITNANGNVVTSNITVYDDSGEAVTDFSTASEGQSFVATTKATHGLMVVDNRPAPAPVPTSVITFETGEGSTYLETFCYETDEEDRTTLAPNTSYTLELFMGDSFEIICEDAPLVSITEADYMTYSFQA